MTTKQFLLPDLGEGLPDATVVEWYVKVGDTIKLDDNLVSMETAKAVVDVPSPVSGKVLKVGGGAGDVIVTGTLLAEFEVDPSMPQRAEGQDTGHHHGPPKGAGAHLSAENVVASDEGGEITETDKPAPKAEREDSGTVVGAMQSSDAVRSEAAVAVGGVKALPAVRALARKLGVDIARVRATGPDGVVTNQDVKNAAADGSAKVGAAPVQSRPAVGPPPAGPPRRREWATVDVVASRQADAHAAAGRAGQRATGTTQGRAPQHGARDGRRAFEGRADDAER
jgi:pyruvate dehydrogenase E2 component (dihydrolipoamide acetyltransferase)